MADDMTTIDKVVWGIVAAMGALYGIILKHFYKHVDKDEIARLKDSVQYKDNCGEIVKRLDGNFKQLNEKLDIILEHVEK